jgi:hypothetical protein
VCGLVGWGILGGGLSFGSDYYSLSGMFTSAYVLSPVHYIIYSSNFINLILTCKCKSIGVQYVAATDGSKNQKNTHNIKA